MNWPPPEHPLWRLLRLVVLMVSLYMILKLTASSFDHTEIRTLVWAFVTAAGLEGVSEWFSRNAN